MCILNLTVYFALVVICSARNIGFDKLLRSEVQQKILRDEGNFRSYNQYNMNWNETLYG